MEVISYFISNLVFNVLNFLGVSFELIAIATLIIKVILVILVIMGCVAYATWLERKIHGAIHMRKGPNVVGPFGLLQPLADGFKLFLKEIIIPKNADKFLFLLAPALTFIVALLGWVVIPLEYKMAFSDTNIGVLYLLATSSLGVYGLVIAGWASNSNYSFLGAIRSTSQMISYELSMGLVVVAIVMLSGSLNLSSIVLSQTSMWYIIKVFPLGVLFFILILAETNRHPFDLPEAESDIVSGYHTEYSGFAFALFFLAEYANMMLMCSFFVVLFLGGWLPLIDFGIFKYIPPFVWFILKVFVLLSFMIQLRSVLPRYRYDQLMRLGWKIFLPISLSAVMFVALILRLSN
jgi:NADH-quinone oxidoreductase subunit H